MNIYLRKILSHDITHQISITKEILNGFFNVSQEKETAVMKGKKSGYRGNVTFLLATDPRFGGDIKQIINAEGGMQEDDILLFIKNRDDYTLEVISRNDERHSTFLSMMELERHLIINIDDETDLSLNSKIDSIDFSELEKSRITNGCNVLLYGVPGSGKSWTIEHEYCKKGTIVERVVFHPDYTNSDFIGQILPIVDSKDKMVTYEFVPGPFTIILRDAYRNPNVPYVLIIEEINRGNAPAIFGDVFQLLDRTVDKKNVDGVEYPKGTSEYGITNGNISKIVYEDEKHEVRIPSNLSIMGTMNTSDQNVFTLDTAFQRRWSMRLIENNFDNVRPSLANAVILDTTVTWKTFCETVNQLIVGNSSKMASAEDKRLGVYFVHENDLKMDERVNPTSEYASTLVELNDLLKHEALETLDSFKEQRLAELRSALLHNRLFPEKVIKYLWDDAFKFYREALFDTENMDSLEKVIRTFVYNKGFDRFKIFRQSVRDSLNQNQNQG